MPVLISHYWNTYDMLKQDQKASTKPNIRENILILATLPTRRNDTKRKKEEIWLSFITKAATPTEKSKTQRDNIKHATKNFDYTTIADRLRTVSWGAAVNPLVWLNRFTSAQRTFCSIESVQYLVSWGSMIRSRYFQKLSFVTLCYGVHEESSIVTTIMPCQECVS